MYYLSSPPTTTNVVNQDCVSRNAQQESTPSTAYPNRPWNNTEVLHDRTKLVNWVDSNSDAIPQQLKGYNCVNAR